MWGGFGLLELLSSMLGAPGFIANTEAEKKIITNCNTILGFLVTSLV